MACKRKLCIKPWYQMRIWKTVITLSGANSIYIPSGVPEGYAEKLRVLFEEAYDDGIRYQKEKSKRELKDAVNTFKQYLQ